MHTMLQYLVRRVIRDQRGAEMVEWVLWVGGIAVVVVAVTTAIQTPIQARIIAIINALPTAAS
jgi:Flp pilus assembly pilin Flp